MLLRCNSRQTVFSLARVNANIFPRLLILFPEEPDLARYREDWSLVKSVATLLLSETFLVPAGILGCTSKASDGQGFLQLKLLRPVDGTPTPEKGHNYSGNQNRERREQCCSHPMAATGNKIHLT